MALKLNEKQKLAIKRIDQFVSQNTEKMFYLLGYAGTGKTFLIGNVVKELLATKKISYFYICAPTHQALNVIESSLKSNLTSSEQVEYITNLNFMTIHKLLEFRPVIVTEDGSKVFKSTRESKFLKQLDNKLIVIDECSMISAEMMAALKKYSDVYPIKIIFMGDRKQLPPVNEIESKIFTSIPTKYEFYVLLDEIMRTKSPEIKEVCTIIRDWNQKDNLLELLLPVHNKKKSFKMYHKKNDYINTTWFKLITDKINTSNNEMPIILTWKNSTAEFYNDIIRKYIHGKTSEQIKNDIDLKNFLVGDYAIFNNFYKSPDDNTSFYTSDMVKIIEITEDEKFLYNWSELIKPNAKSLIEKDLNIMLKKFTKQKKIFKVNMLTIERIHNDIQSAIKIPHKIQIIHKDEIDEYTKMLDTIKAHIEYFYKKYKSRGKEIKIVDKLWEIYHDKLMSPFAEIKFGYAITTHKAQGSTFQSVFVDIQDINENPNRNEMQRALYTAASRASTFLGFLVE